MPLRRPGCPQNDRLFHSLRERYRGSHRGAWFGEVDPVFAGTQVEGEQERREARDAAHDRDRRGSENDIRTADL